MRLKTFRLTDAAFAELAAGRPSMDTVGLLRRAQASRHLLLLGEIRRLGGTIPDPIERYDPMAALHTSVTLAALRSGTAPPPPRVTAPHDLTTTHAGLTLRVRLEDTDPLRSHLGLTPSERLTPDAVATWRDLLVAAWQLLTTRHRPAAEILAAVLSVIVPVEPDPDSGGLSATSANAYGAVAMSTPGDPRSFAVGLLHEGQHSLLNATTTLFDLVEPGGPRIYSPWRDDPRPLSGLLHGAYAYQSVTRFWRTEAATRIPAQRQGRAALPPNQPGAENSLAHLSATEPPALDEAGPRGPAALRGRLAEFEFARWRAAVAEAAEALLAGGHLTAAGARFVQIMRREVGGWTGDAIDPRVARLAAGANAEHRARWRLRNLAVREETLAEVVAAWQRDAPAPGAIVAGAAAPGAAGHSAAGPGAAATGAAGAELREDGGRQLESSVRLSLAHQLLREGDAGGVRPGDAAYLAGDAGAALDAYTEELAARRSDASLPLSSRDLDLWSGVAVVSPHRALREQPELVRAVWLSVADAALGDVARWLSGSLKSSRG